VPSPEAPASLIIAASCSATLVWVCVTDLRRRVIPNRALVSGSIPVILALAILSPELLPGRLVWALLAALPLTLISLVEPQAMGMGDAKLVAFLGLCLGSSVLVALAFAALAGSVVGIGILVRRGTGARTVTIPFAPYLGFGSLAACAQIIWGLELTHLAGT